MPLQRNYRFTALNGIGQTVGTGNLVIKARRWKYDATTGAKVFESSEATLWTNAGTIANGAYLSSSSIDNSTDLWEGGSFAVSLTSPASSTGALTIYYEVSTDGGTTYCANGNGFIACVIPAVSSAPTVEHFIL